MIGREPQGNATKIGGATIPFVKRSEPATTAPGTANGTANGRHGLLGKILNVIDPVPAAGPGTASAGPNYAGNAAQPASVNAGFAPSAAVPEDDAYQAHHAGRDAALAGGAVGGAAAAHHHAGHHAGPGYDARSDVGPDNYDSSTGPGNHDSSTGRRAYGPSTCPGMQGTQRADPVADYGPGALQGQNGNYGNTATNGAYGDASYRPGAGPAGATNVNPGIGNGNAHYGGNQNYADNIANPSNGPAGGATGNTAPSHGHANLQEMKGRTQGRFGNVTGSNNMQARGAANQQQGTAEHGQRGELNEADRLESDAQWRRDRAVAGGAHPVHQNMGGRPQAGTAY